ncbi:hypothetical protein HG537_0D06450 [Torulaspora globosa]|uniref:IPT/TIG domain-containing protein n=1 Tax=Torulaspora globosa TaxID=48254 RepID=A0A7H9HSC9_9SACH|nr:hypothetical protein HG537_0D06450 [Torulaspora sp. CBS 2947]
MIAQLRKEVYREIGPEENGSGYGGEEVDMLESDMLNDFLFRSAESRENVDGSEKELGSGRNEDEDAIFDAFINTDSLDGGAGVNNGLVLNSRFNGGGDEFQQPAFSMTSAQLDGRLVGNDGIVSDPNSRSPTPISDSAGYHRQCQETVENSLIFGRTEPLQTSPVDPTEYVSLDETCLPYRLSVYGLPEVSRVENQIKLSLKIDPSMRPCMVHLPSDCIARQKFYLEKDISQYPQEFQDQLIYVEAFLLCAASNNTTFVCARCVKREHRRASRRKSGLSDNVLWCNNNNRRAIIFNNKQVFVTKETDRDGSSTEFDLTARIVCYCRHHKSPEGFKILFILKNSKGQVLAKNVTSSIVIMDKKPSHATTESPIIAQCNSNTDSGLDTAGEVFSNANSSDRPATTSASDNGNQEIQFNSGKYFAMTDISPLKMEADLNMRLALPNGSMLSPTSMSEEGSEAQASAVENRRLSHPIGSASTSAAAARTESYQRKRQRNEAVPDNSLMSRRTWSNSSLSKSLSSPHVSQPSSQVLRTMPDFMSTPHSSQPSIQRVIPAQGPINGGIEITLLGTKFKDGLLVKFGENIALSTQCWSDTTMVTYLPPASCAGQVFVTVIDPDDSNLVETHPSNKAVFTYVDDTDRQLIELALQIVGLKMNGKLEDARNIAKRIIGNDAGSNSLSPSNISPGNNSSTSQSSTHKNIGYSDELLLVKVVKSLHVNSNLSMCDNLGRTLLHLASLKGYSSLCSTLIKNGARVNDKDLYGFTPLHFACVGGDVRVIRLLAECKADPSIKACNFVTARQLFVANHKSKIGLNHYFKEVTDLLDDLEATNIFSSNSRKMSDSSFHSSVFENESLYSLDNSNVGIKTAAINKDDDRSEYNESDFEEDGDESLLTGDEVEEVADLNVEDTETKKIIKKGGKNGMDKSLLNRMLHYLNDELPKYEDLFPGSHGTGEDKVKPGELQTEATSTTEDFQTSSEDEEDALQQGFNGFFQQRQNFQNDKMLLFFWLPLTIVLLTWYVIYRFGQEDDLVHYFTKMVSEYLRMVLAKILLGNERMKTAFKEQLTMIQNTGILNDFIVT